MGLCIHIKKDLSIDGRYKISALEPNTWITGVSSNKDSIYIIVNTNATILGTAAKEQILRDGCILFNPAMGSLVTVKKNQMVTVVKPTIQIKKVVNPTEDYWFTKHKY